MNLRRSRRTFLKQLGAFSTFSAASILSFKRKVGVTIGRLGLTEADAMNNPEHEMANSSNEIKIEYKGMSCFLITTGNGTRIITDPFHADNQVLHPELSKEPADIVTVSCGNYAHCYIWDVGGMPYIYQITEPTEIKGIKFRGVATRHLEMKEVSTTRPGDNIIMCFEVDGIKICHLGALGHKLSDEQVKQVGKVDILMVPVGGVSTLPLDDANEVCSQLNPKVIIPMHYRSERCVFPTWATVDDFLNKNKKYVAKFRTRGGAAGGEGPMLFKLAGLPSETQIYAPGHPK